MGAALRLWFMARLVVLASLVVEHRLLGRMGLVALWHVESSGSGIELVFPALGGFLSTLLPGKSSHSHFEDKICV